MLKKLGQGFELQLLDMLELPGLPCLETTIWGGPGWVARV